MVPDPDQRSRCVGSRGAIGYFFLLSIIMILLMTMGLFMWTRKGSEQAVFTRFQIMSRSANAGAIAEAFINQLNGTVWNAGAVPTNYQVAIDSDNVTTVTIDCVEGP